MGKIIQAVMPSNG